MSEVVYRSEVRIERVKGPVRKAYLPAESEPVIFGVTVQVPWSILLDKSSGIGYRMVDECAASRPAAERSGT
jgi:hypothetical protein